MGNEPSVKTAASSSGNSLLQVPSQRPRRSSCTAIPSEVALNINKHDNFNSLINFMLFFNNFS